jgi:hypothetical protein
VTANKKWCIGRATSNPHAEPIEKAEIVLVLLIRLYEYLLDRKEMQDGCSKNTEQNQHVGIAGKHLNCVNANRLILNVQ